MVKQTTSIVLFGKKITTVSGDEITDKKSYVEHLERERKLKDIYKRFFEHRGETSTGQKLRKNYWINPILEFPSRIKNEIDRACGCGHDLVFLLGMELDRIDVKIMDENQRVFIPKTELLMNYLTEEEKIEMVKQGSNGLSVLGFGPKAETNNYKLMLWPNIDVGTYWKKKWAKLVDDKGVRRYIVLELWCFRDGCGKLCVVLNTEKRALFDHRNTGGCGGVRIGGGKVN